MRAFVGHAILEAAPGRFGVCAHPMAAPGAFHPKICLLASKKRCVLFIGSHNLTLSGFGFNREVTTHIDVRPDSAPAHKLVLSHVWSLVREWLRTQEGALAPSVLEAVHRIGELVPGADGAQSKLSDIRLLGQSSSGPSLLEQLGHAIPSTPRRVVITGAFFDTQHTFLKALETRWPGASIKVIIDPKTVKIGGRPKGIRSQFVDARKLWMEKAEHYLHAKALLLDFGDSHMLVAGSANPSRPAWLGGTRANFEAMLVRPTLKWQPPASPAILLRALQPAQWMTPNCARFRSHIRMTRTTLKHRALRCGSPFLLRVLLQSRSPRRTLRDSRISSCTCRMVPAPHL